MAVNNVVRPVIIPILPPKVTNLPKDANTPAPKVIAFHPKK